MTQVSNIFPYIARLLQGAEVVWKPLEEVATFRRGSFPQPYTKSEWYGGDNSMPFVQVADMEDNKFNLVPITKQKISQLAMPKSIFVPKGTILVSLQGTIGRVAITQYDSYVDRTIAIFTHIDNEIDIRYFAYQLQLIFGIKKENARGSTIKTITKEEFSAFQIPLPPLSVQQEIVRILDKFTQLEAELEAELESRKRQYEYYRNKLLTFNEIGEGTKVEWKTLGEIGEIRMCKRILKEQTSDYGEIPFYKIGTFGKDADAYISKELFNEYRAKYNYPNVGDILISASGTIGRTVIFDGKEAYFQDSNIVWIENDQKKVLNKYLFYCYQIAKWNISEGGTIQRLYNDNLRKTLIPIPYPNNPEKSLEEQQRIASILDKFDTLVNSISEGLPKEIALRRKQYEYYRERLLSFPKE